MVLHQVLVEMFDRKTLVALAIEPLHLLRPVDRNPFARRPAEPAIHKPGLALLTRQRRVHRRNVRSLTPSNSAASAWFSSADSQRLRMFKNIAMRTP